MIFDENGNLQKPPHYVDEAGLCMHCNKQAFLNSMASVPEVPVYNYVEIGIYNGETLKWACDYLSSNRPEWTAYGVEIPEWLPQKPRVERLIGPYGDRVRIDLRGAEKFLLDCGIQASFVFIDGCHSTGCCRMNFELAEKIVHSGGIVAIHDIDPGYQGLDPGLHCKEGIGVLRAITELGLFNKTRPGWNEIGRTEEDYANHGCLFVQKT